MTILNILNNLIIRTFDSKMQLAKVLREEVHKLQQTLDANIQKQRNEVEKKRGYVFYVMHDIKSALAGILSCAEILGTGDLALIERQEFLRIIASEIDRVVGMTQNLVEFAYGRQKPLQLQTLSVRDFMQTILPIIKYLLASRNISIHLDLRYTGKFQVNPEKMKQVFMNIVYNALDAMPDGGSLTITSWLVNDMVQFEFTDTGRGMSSELQARFLEPHVTEGKSNGIGLGMAIVKDILDEHHAHTEVKSIMAHGTTIRILLPCIQNNEFMHCKLL